MAQYRTMMTDIMQTHLAPIQGLDTRLIALEKTVHDIDHKMDTKVREQETEIVRTRDEVKELRKEVTTLKKDLAVALQPK